MVDRVAHYMRQNHAGRVPRRMVTIDSEANRAKRRGGETHRMKVAVGAFDRLDVTGRPQGEPEWFETADDGDLWRWVGSKTATSHRTVVFAHNLAYDLRITKALEHLPSLGFDCKGIALTNYSCWARFHDGRRSLWLCDTLSWLPVPLERVASLLRRRKPSLPGDLDPASLWLKRCRADVAITREAMLRVIGWLHDDDLGDFRLTGAAQSQAAFRHRFLEPRALLVHDNAEAIAAERVACFAGRCETWRHGQVDGDVTEWDFTASYARIAAEHELPARLMGERGPTPLDRAVKLAAHYAVLAECTITTDVPIVPALHHSRIVWPVGTFDTTLWSPEWLAAAEAGADVAVRRLWLYRRKPILADWSRWVLAGLAGEPPGDDPVVRVVLKEWSRALIGRFGLRYATMEQVGVSASHDFALYPVRDAASGTDSTFLQLGPQLFEQGERVEARSSMPQIMGAVMSLARMRLWRCMQTAGLDHVLYVDTDGLLVDATGSRRLSAAVNTGELDGLRRKAGYKGAVLRGPRNVDLGDQRRVSGVPRRAERLAPGVYRGEVWETLPGSLRRRRSGQVELHERLFNVADVDPRRLHLPDGATAALTLVANSA